MRCCQHPTPSPQHYALEDWNIGGQCDEQGDEQHTLGVSHDLLQHTLAGEPLLGQGWGRWTKQARGVRVWQQ